MTALALDELGRAMRGFQAGRDRHVVAPAADHRQDLLFLRAWGMARASAAAVPPPLPAPAATLAAPPAGLRKRWEEEQAALKTRLMEEDDLRTWRWDAARNEPTELRLIGGVDVSFVKGDAETACACLVVLSFPALELVYQRCEMVRLDQPYIPGFLAFRESRFIEALLAKLRQDQPDLFPQVVLVDGNGVLHPRGLGLASHLGIVTDVCTVGIGKNLLHVDGVTKDMVRTEAAKAAKEARAAAGAGAEDVAVDVALRGNSGRVWGRAVTLAAGTQKPVYVSVGHRISLDTAVRLSKACAKYRIPEPVRQADLVSREFLRSREEEARRGSSGGGAAG